MRSEPVPFTMQADAWTMTQDEATAAGLSDRLDEPGMVRIAVTLEVVIPDHLLTIPPTPSGNAADDDVPPGVASRRARTRFGN